MKVLAALGGNAILQSGTRGTAAEQTETVDLACKTLVQMVKRGHDIAVTHGNGPQVGDILLANEMAKRVLSPMPLDVCGAESQGMIGYMIQQSMQNELRNEGLKREVVSVLTQTRVDASDTAFANPTKPIGPFYSASAATKLGNEKKWVMKKSDKGYRRVVPSPDPLEIIESAAIRNLFNSGVIVVSTGGGGVPVVKDQETGKLRGVEAVIDKDLGAALLAQALEVDLLMILTDVDGVSLDFGTPKQRMLGFMSLADCKLYSGQGQFPPGSMGPKVEAVSRFIEKTGRRAVITSIAKAEDALEGKAGTFVALKRDSLTAQS